MPIKSLLFSYWACLGIVHSAQGESSTYDASDPLHCYQDAISAIWENIAKEIKFKGEFYCSFLFICIDSSTIVLTFLIDLPRLSHAKACCKLDASWTWSMVIVLVGTALFKIHLMTNWIEENDLVETHP